MGSVLNLDQFRAAFRSGGLRSVSIQAAGGEFFITAEPRTGERVTLATTHGGKLRAFRDPGKAIAILHAIGAHKVGVDTSAWSPAQANLLARRRPDTAARQRRTHEAAAHDAWFRSEVEQALREADKATTTQWISQGEAKRQSAGRRGKWRAKAGAEKAAS
jgi:ornithine carbamoyltransferase